MLLERKCIKSLKEQNKGGRKQDGGGGGSATSPLYWWITNAFIHSESLSSEYDRAELFLEKRAAPRRASVLRHAVRNADKVDRKLSPSSLSIVGSIRASGRQPVDCGGQERTDGRTDRRFRFRYRYRCSSRRMTIQTRQTNRNWF